MSRQRTAADLPENDAEALFDAVRDRNVAEARRLLARGLDPNAGYTAWGRIPGNEAELLARLEARRGRTER